MNGFARALVASAFALFSSAVFGQSYQQSSVIAEYAIEKISVVSESGHTNEFSELSHPGASFIKVHFEDFRPPPGMTVEVRNPDGSESYLYSRDFKDAHTFDADLGDDGVTSFYSMSISGDTAIIEVHGKHGYIKSFEKSAKNRVSVDHVVRGFGLEKKSSSTESGKSKGGSSTQSDSSGGSFVESTCGQDERYDAVCWAGSDPAAYDRSRPVARIIFGTSGCTAWRVGPANHMFTNNHCVASQAELSAAEVWFNYEQSVCGGEGTETIVKVSGAELISTDYTLDYSLFSVNDFASIESFGNLGLEVRDANLSELIYIPQHGEGDPKQISIDSDMNVNGVCQVDAEDYYGGTDIGYYCDTTGGSSGSPVLLADTQKAIALHHRGGCLNSGVKMSLIWSKVKRYFGREVPEGNFDPDSIVTPDNDPNPDPQQDETPIANFGIACSYLDCRFDGSSSSDAEGSLVGYAWNFGDQSTADGETTPHTYAEAGSYDVSLTVTDSAGNTDTTNKTVTVVEPNENNAPTAEMSVGCISLDCSFNAADSSDVDGTIVSYSWSFGDGASGSGWSAQHVYASSGSYEVTLTVEDDGGLSTSVTETVTVQEPVIVISSMELSAVGQKIKGRKSARLNWVGSEASQVRIYRDNVALTVTENAGAYVDESIGKRTKSVTYKVCETVGTTCSNEVEVKF